MFILIDLRIYLFGMVAVPFATYSRGAAKVHEVSYAFVEYSLNCDLKVRLVPPVSSCCPIACSEGLMIRPP